jgi:hypothetical protein
MGKSIFNIGAVLVLVYKIHVCFFSSIIRAEWGAF